MPSAPHAPRAGSFPDVWVRRGFFFFPSRRRSKKRQSSVHGWLAMANADKMNKGETTRSTLCVVTVPIVYIVPSLRFSVLCDDESCVEWWKKKIALQERYFGTTHKFQNLKWRKRQKHNHRSQSQNLKQKKTKTKQKEKNHGKLRLDLVKFSGFAFLSSLAFGATCTTRVTCGRLPVVFSLWAPSKWFLVSHLFQSFSFSTPTRTIFNFRHEMPQMVVKWSRH